MGSVNKQRMIQWRFMGAFYRQPEDYAGIGAKVGGGACPA